MADLTIVKQSTTLVNDVYTNSVILQSGNKTVVISAPGPQGPAGRDGADGGAFDWVQSSPSASWLIPHNMNKYPSVTLNVAGQIVYADVDYVDLNNVAVVYPAPTSGSAHLV